MALPRLDENCKRKDEDLMCGDGKCIPRERFCDGKEFDCHDNSDESICSFGDDRNPNKAPVCDKDECKLPKCFCSEDGESIPNDLNLNEVPQMVLISFNGAVYSKVCTFCSN